MDNVLYVIIIVYGLALMWAIYQNIRLLNAIREIGKFAYEESWGVTSINMQKIAEIVRSVK